MYSVYSNYLDPLINAEIVKLTKNDKPSEILDGIRYAYSKGIIGVLNNVRIISSSIADDEDYYEIIWRSQKLIEWLQWVNKNIVLIIGKETYRTIQVRVRIATSMLNKLVEENLITTKNAIKIHLNLVENVGRETMSIVNEDLPF